MNLRELGRTNSPIVLLEPTPRGEVLAGCDDGEVLLLQDQTLRQVFPPTGAPTRAAAQSGRALVTLDGARLVRRRVGSQTRRWVFPYALSRDVLWASAEVVPTVVAAAIHPVEPVIAVVVNAHDAGNGYRIALLDWKAKRALPGPSLPDLSGAVELDHHYSLCLDALAFAPDGETLVMSGRATLYNSIGDWEYGSPRRVLATRWRGDEGLGAVDLEVVDRPSEHVPMPIAFCGGEVLVGSYRVPAQQLQAGYTEEADDWCSRPAVCCAADPAGAWAVAVVRREQGDRLVIRDLSAPEPIDLGELPLTRAVAMDARRGRVLIGAQDGRLLELVLEPASGEARAVSGPPPEARPRDLS